MGAPPTDTIMTSTKRSARDIARAVDSAVAILKPIGQCRTSVSSWVHRSSELDTNASDAKEEAVTKCLDEVASILAPYSKMADFGYLARPFSLSVTRSGCEFEGQIIPRPPDDEIDGSIPPLQPSSTPELDEETVRAWFEHGNALGPTDEETVSRKYHGDPPPIWNVREILSEYHISPALVPEIEQLWAARFVPSRVRAVPRGVYTIGPEGFFRSFRDPAELGLVGVVILGLLDTSVVSEITWSNVAGGALLVEGYEVGLKSSPGWWVAFHPDARYELSPIVDGFRAMLVFGIYCDAEDLNGGLASKGPVDESTTIAVEPSPSSPPPSSSSLLHDASEAYEGGLTAIAAAFSKIPSPLGILLTHQYSIGATEKQLQGADSLLFAAAQRVPGAAVHIIPVVTRLTATAVVYDDHDPEESTSVGRQSTDSAQAPVVALTRTHVEAVLSSLSESHAKVESEEEGDDAVEFELGAVGNVVPDLDACGSGVQWMRDLNDVPFFSLNLDGEAESAASPTSLTRGLDVGSPGLVSGLVNLGSDEDDEDFANVRGVGSNMDLEDESVYLSFAMVFLPPPSQS